MSDGAPHEIFKADGFGHKLGPLPVWGWALIVAVGAFIVYRWQQSQTASTTAGTPSTALPAYSDSGDATPSGSYFTGTDGSSSSAAGAFTDNQSWLNAALGEASNFGTTATELNGALTDWLNGSTLSTQQASWVDQVVGSLGAPPTGTLGASTVATGTTASTFAAENSQNYGFNYESGGTVDLINKNNGESAPISSYGDYVALLETITGQTPAGAGPTSQNVANQTNYLGQVNK